MTDEVAAHMSHLWSLDRMELSSAAPGNDVLYPMTCEQLNPSVTDRYAQYLRESTGRATQADLDAMLAQITKGGDLRPFATTQFSKEVAKKISGNAPMGDCLKPLLSGDYQTAARVAWKRSRLASDTSEHDTWIKMVALSVACQDQYRGGRATAFLKWANPDAPVTPANKAVVADALASYLGDAPLVFHPTDGDLAAAAAHLNQIKSIAALDEQKIIGPVLPDNDVLVLAMHSPDPVRHYMRLPLAGPPDEAARTRGTGGREEPGDQRGKRAPVRCFRGSEATGRADLRQSAAGELSQAAVDRRLPGGGESRLEKGPRRQNGQCL